LRRTSRLVLLLGVFLAAVVFIVILVLNPGGPGGPGQAQATTPPTTADSVIAVKDIKLGTVVTADMVTKQVLSLTARDADTLGDPSQAIGQTARKAITAGAQVHVSDFQVGGISQVLEVPKGSVAMALEVNELTGVGNLVHVGDTIDVVISLSGGAFPVVNVLPDGTITTVTGIFPLSVKLPLVLEEVQVIGTLDAPAAAPASGQAAPQPSQGETGAILAAGSKLLILAVSPAQAEVLVFARDLNPQSLIGNPDHIVSQVDIVLRSSADAGVKVATDGVILKTLIDKYGVLPPQLVQTVLPKP